MPIRTTPLVEGEIYHIFNRGVGSIPIFKRRKDYQRLLQLIEYYQYLEAPGRFSKFLELSRSQREDIMTRLKNKNQRQISLIAYCLMPNHFHLLIRQEGKNGIQEFMRLLQNSYSRYFNNKYHRKGALFENRFKAVRIETEEQLLHLSRYIHLNPYSSYVVKNRRALLQYPYSSLKEYLKNQNREYCQKEMVLSYFKGKKQYRKFVFDRADYQRSLENIKHQLYE